MNTLYEQLARDCPEVDPAFVREYVSRLPGAYFKRFGGPDLARHLRALHRLGPD